MSRGTMSLYVQRILEIPQLTNQGSLQLAADIRTATTTRTPYLCFRTALPPITDEHHLLAGWMAGYLCTILSALRVTPAKSLAAIQHLLEVPVSEYAPPHTDNGCPVSGLSTGADCLSRRWHRLTSDTGPSDEEVSGGVATYRAQIAKIRGASSA